jgi:hypothetical protein
MKKVLDGIQATEFNQLIEQFIERDDPDALSAAALDQAARQQLEQVTTTRVELTGIVREGQIAFDPSTDAPIITRGNELVIGGLHVVVKLRPETAH